MTNIIINYTTNTNIVNLIITNFKTNNIYLILTPQDWWKLLTSNFIFPLIVGISAFIATYYISQVNIRKKYSLIGVSIIKSFLEEVENGLSIMNEIQSADHSTTAFIPYLPNKSWSGMQSIPDEVLERIILLSKKSTEIGFPLDEIRIHLKNYFENMCSNINQMIELYVKGEGNWVFQKIVYFENGKYIESTKKIILMLNNAKSLLIENYRKVWPT